MNYRMIKPLLILTITGLLTISCGSDSTDPAQIVKPIVPSGGTAVIDPAGGSVGFTTADDIVVTFTFPAGAVLVPTTVTVLPVETQSGHWINVELEPAGMVFYEEFTVDVTFPDDRDLTNAVFQMGDPLDPIFMPADLVDPSQLRTTGRFFGLNDDGTLIAPSGPGEMDAVLMPGNNPNRLGLGPIECQAIIAEMKAEFAEFIRTGSFRDAIDAAGAIATALFMTTCPGDDAWFDAASRTACDGLIDAIGRAATTPISQYGEFETQVQDIMKWASIAQKFNTNCYSIIDWYSAVVEKAIDFTVFFEGEISRFTTKDFILFSDLKGELSKAYKLITQGQLMGNSDVETVINEYIIWPYSTEMRKASYDLCVSETWHYPVTRMTSTGFFAARDIAGQATPRPGLNHPAPTSYAKDFSDEDVIKDLHMCGLCIDVETLAASGGVLATGHMEGTSPGVFTDEVTIKTPTRGQINISGLIAPFECYDLVDSDEELIVSFDNTDFLFIRRPIAGHNYLSDPILVDIAQAAAHAGIVPAEGLISDLAIRRKRTACDDRLWGDKEYELVKTRLDWENPTLELEVGVPANADPGETVNVSVNVKVMDQLNQAGFFEGIDLVLQSSGGTLQQLTGTTDSQGNFHTFMTVDSPLLIINGKSGEAIFGASVTASATSFEGVTAQGTASVAVGSQGTALLLPHLSYSGDAQISRFGKKTRDLQEYFDQPNPGGWTFNATVEADTSFDGKSVLARANTTGNTSISIAGDVLVSFSGSASGSSQLTTSGDFTSSKIPWVNQLAEFTVPFEVVGGQVSYTLSATTSVTGSYDVAVELVGGSLVAGFGRTQPPDAPPASVNQSGVLNPGRYSFTAFSGSNDRCTNCSKLSNTMIGFTLTLGAP